MQNWPENPCVTVSWNNFIAYIGGGLFGWGTHVSKIDPGCFSNEAFRTAYVDELQKLLGPPFHVGGSDTQYGDVITSDLPYPHSDVVSEAYVGVSWGKPR
jgi:hypothetical protein